MVDGFRGGSTCENRTHGRFLRQKILLNSVHLDGFRLFTYSRLCGACGVKERELVTRKTMPKPKVSLPVKRLLLCSVIILIHLLFCYHPCFQNTSSPGPCPAWYGIGFSIFLIGKYW